jgi:hypothetical protein
MLHHTQCPGKASHCATSAQACHLTVRCASSKEFFDRGDDEVCLFMREAKLMPLHSRVGVSARAFQTLPTEVASSHLLFKDAVANLQTS